MRYVPTAHDAAAQLLAADPDATVRIARGSTMEVESTGATGRFDLPRHVQAVEADGWLVVALRGRLERVRIATGYLERYQPDRIMEAALGFAERYAGDPNAPPPLRLTGAEGDELADRVLGRDNGTE